VNDAPRWRPGVTLLLSPVTGGCFVAGQRQRYRHERNLPLFGIVDIVKGAFSCFSSSENQGFVMAVEKPVCLCGSKVVETKFSE